LIINKVTFSEALLIEKVIKIEMRDFQKLEVNSQIIMIVGYTQLSHNEHNESIDHLEFVLNASEQGVLNTARSTTLVKGNYTNYTEKLRNGPTKVVLDQIFY